MKIEKFEYEFTTKFGELSLNNELFYNVNTGLRFELGNPYESDEKKYIAQVYYRSITLFEEIFSDLDNIYLIIDSKENLKPTRIFQKYLKNKGVRYKLAHKKITNSDIGWPELETNRFYLECNKNDIYYQKLLMSIGNKDFTIRPKIKPYEDCYFVNLQKGVIFNQYDDRGLDIVAIDKELLYTLYKKYNHWILQYDKERIDSMFK